MTYIQLQAGDIRQNGDQLRRDRGKGSIYCQGTDRGSACWEEKTWPKARTQAPDLTRWEPWHEVDLISHPILPSDLILTQFRRPKL